MIFTSFAAEPSESKNTIPAVKAVSYDLNNDGKINDADISIMLAHYGKNDNTYDVNGDGQFNTLDLSLLIKNYGK